MRAAFLSKITLFSSALFPNTSHGVFAPNDQAPTHNWLLAPPNSQAHTHILFLGGIYSPSTNT